MSERKEEVAEEPAKAQHAKTGTGAATWASLGLDPRTVRAAQKMGWYKPTAIQRAVIGCAMEGRDILARGRTGSGKTGAYALPLINAILKAKEERATSAAPGQEHGILSLVLVPTKELVDQTTETLKTIASCCEQQISIVPVLASEKKSKRKETAALLTDLPDVVVGTPTTVLEKVQSKHIVVTDDFKMLVLDEADLILTYGHDDAVRELSATLPSVKQSLLLSATMTEDIDALKSHVVLRSPAIIKLEESDLPDDEQLKQHALFCIDDDKHLNFYALLALKLLSGKTLVFVNTVHACYKLKLFLERFSIRSCVLNSRLPANSRRHIVTQFNKGIYNIIIASDETGGNQGKKVKPRNPKFSTSDNEYGVVRGVDFKDVTNVINFDFPPTVERYIHRVGRTARGRANGLALSFVEPKQRSRLQRVEAFLRQQEREAEGEDDAAPVEDDSQDPIIRPYTLKTDVVTPLRYRVEDALRHISKRDVEFAIRRDIENQLLNSQALKAHFEDNPRDLQVLRHDTVLHRSRDIKPHLKELPFYLKPKAGEAEALRVKRRKQKQRGRGAGNRNGGKAAGKKGHGKGKRKTNEDPLRSFKSSKRAK